MNKIFQKENIMFGLIWGVIVWFIGAFLTKVLNFIDMVFGKILDLSLWIFLAPAKIVEFTNLSSNALRFTLVMLIAVLTAPLIRKAYEAVKAMFKKNPI